MLTVIDIIKALTTAIETKFPDYPVNSRDIEEGFDRPSYFLDVEDVTTEQFTSNYVKETSNLVIYFFASDIHKGFLKLLQTKNELLKLLAEPLPLTNKAGDILGHACFGNISATINKSDMALTCTMSGELIQQNIFEPDNPVIEELALEMED